MNGKNINDIIKLFLPVSSTFIGAPRKLAGMSDYLNNHPDAGTIAPCEAVNFAVYSTALQSSFFQSHELVLKHANFIASLNGARVWGTNGAVIGAGDYFISDVSREFNKGLHIDHSVYYTIKQIKSTMLKGTTALIGTVGANIYYHWMLDILPRLALIAKHISIEQIDYFVTAYTQLPFQTETLNKAGIPLHKIIASNENWNFHIQAERLLVPSLAGPLDQPTPAQINFLRTLYSDCMHTKKPFRKLYISRKKAGRREIVNENELIDYLLIYGFEIIYCEEMAVAEQVSLFSEATFIIGSHGSAFTNLVFCQPNTTVVDIFNASHINPCFWFISKMLDLEYHSISGKSKSIDSNPKNDHTIVDIMLFKKTLQTIGLR